MADLKTQPADAGKSAYEIEKMQRALDNKPDIFAIGMDMDEEKMDSQDIVSSLAAIMRETPSGFALRDKSDYWNISSVKEKFENDQDAFEKKYNRIQDLFSLSDAINVDIQQVFGINTPEHNDDKATPLQDRAIESLGLNAFDESHQAKGTMNTSLGISADRDRMYTVKKLSQMLGVRNEDGDWNESPGIWDQLSTSDIFRVARDEKGNPKMTLTGSHYIERVKGDSDVLSSDQMVNVFSSGALENTWFDGNRIDQSAAAVLARQIHKFVPYTRVVPFVSAAASGLAEFIKSIGDAAHGNTKNETHRTMNYFQNWLKKFDMDMDENSKASMWNPNNIINSIGQIGPQVLGMAAVGKLPAQLMGLKSAQQAGFKGLKMFSHSAEEFAKSGTAAQQKVASILGSTISRGGMSLMATEDFAKEAKEAGLTPNEALFMHSSFLTFMHFGPSKYTEKIGKPIEQKYGSLLSKKLWKSYSKNLMGITAKGEAITPKILGKTGEKMAKAYASGIDRLTKIYNSSGEAGVMGYLGAGTNEFLEESLEYSGEEGLKWLFNNTYDVDRAEDERKFNANTWDNFAKELFFSGAMGFAGGGIGKAAMGNPGVQRKATQVTDENVITYMSENALDMEKRERIDRDFKKIKPGEFGSTQFSFEVDEATGKYLTVNSKSTNPAERMSQDEIIRNGFIAVWEGVKATADQKIMDVAGKGVKWDNALQEAFGSELSTIYSSAQEDMGVHIRNIVKYESEIGKIEERKKNTEGTVPVDDGKDQKTKADLKKEIAEAEKKIEEIVSGKAAHNYFEKAIYTIDSTINVTSDGTKISENAPEAGYVSYEEFKSTRQKALDDSKHIVEEDNLGLKNLSDLKSRISAMISKDEVEQLLKEDFAYDDELSELLNKKMDEIYDLDPITLDKVKKAAIKGLASFTNPNPEAEEKINAATSISEIKNIQLGTDDDEEIYAGYYISNNVPELGKDMLTPDVHKLLENKKKFKTQLIPQETDTESLKKDILAETDPDKLYELVMKGDRMVSQKDIAEIHKHINSLMTDSKDYIEGPDGKTVTGISKNQRFANMSRKLRSVSVHKPEFQAMLKSLNMDSDSGNKDLFVQIREEMDAMKTNPQTYSANLKNLDRLRRTLHRKREIAKAILTVDAMTAKFQIINRKKFSLENEIENFIPAESLVLLEAYINAGKTDVEKLEAKKKLDDSLKPFTDSLLDYLTDIEYAFYDISALNQKATANHEGSVEGIQKSDMLIMDEDITALGDIVNEFLGVENPLFENLVKGANGVPGIDELLSIAEKEENYGAKARALKDAEIAIHLAFDGLSESQKVFIMSKIRNLNEVEDVDLFNYFDALSRPTFKHIHDKYREAIKDMESPPTYEQERAAIQMAVSFLDGSGDRYGVRQSHLHVKGSKKQLDSFGVVYGVGGSGKTFMASVVAKMLGKETSVLMTTPGAEQQKTLEGALKKQKVEIVSSTKDGSGNYSIRQLIDDLNTNAESVNSAGLIIIDEVTYFSEKEIIELQTTLDKFNSSDERALMSNLQVLALGDNVQAGKISRDDENLYMEDNILLFKEINNTKVLRTSQRTGNTPNNTLLQSIRKRIEGNSEEYKANGKVTVNFRVATKDNEGDAGIEIIKSGIDPNSRIIQKIKDAQAKKQSIVYISDRGVSETAHIEALGVKVLTVAQVQGSEYDHVIVDLKSLGSSTNYSTDKIKLKHWYTAISRARESVLIANAFDRPWESVEGLVTKADSKFSSDSFSELKRIRMAVVNDLIKLEEQRFGVNPQAAAKEDTRDKDAKLEDLSIHSGKISADVLNEAFAKYIYSLEDDVYNNYPLRVHAANFKATIDFDLSDLISESTSYTNAEENLANFENIYEESIALKSYFNKSKLASDLKIDLNSPPDKMKDPEEIINFINNDDNIGEPLKSDLLQLLDEYNNLINTPC